MLGVAHTEYKKKLWSGKMFNAYAIINEVVEYFQRVCSSLNLIWEW